MAIQLVRPRLVDRRILNRNINAMRISRRLLRRILAVQQGIIHRTIMRSTLQQQHQGTQVLRYSSRKRMWNTCMCGGGIQTNMAIDARVASCSMDDYYLIDN